MEQSRTKSLQNNFFRYLLAGGSSYGIELSFLLVCVHVFHIDVVLATSVAYIVGLLVTFALQKILGFQNNERNAKSLSIQLVGYLTLVGINYLFTLFVVSLFSSDLLFVSRTFALICTTAWNFFIYKVIFKNRV